MQLIYFRIKASYIMWYSRLGNHHIIVFVDKGKNNSWQMMITTIAFWEEASWNVLLFRVKGAWVHEITAGRWARTSGSNLKLKKSKVILLLSVNRTQIVKHWLLLRLPLVDEWKKSCQWIVSSFLRPELIDINDKTWLVMGGFI